VHVLVTADTLSGSWSFTRELVTGLVTRGVRVTLVTFGEIPLPDQTTWMDLLHGLEYRPTAFRLEWMDDAPRDLPESSEFLAGLVNELRPDVLHLHQFCHGNLPVNVPRVVMAQGDLISWAEAVQGCAPRPSRWLNWYRKSIVNGIAAADAVVAPSAWMLDAIGAAYTRPRRGTVIYPGRNPIFFNPYVSNDDSVLSVGRLHDAGKQVFLLTQHPHPFSVCIVGAEQTVPMPRIPIRADVKVSTDQSCVAVRGPQTEASLLRRRDRRPQPFPRRIDPGGRLRARRLATRPGPEPAASVEDLTRYVMDVIWLGFNALRDGARWVLVVYTETAGSDEHDLRFGAFMRALRPLLSNAAVR